MSCPWALILIFRVSLSSSVIMVSVKSNRTLRSFPLFENNLELVNGEVELSGIFFLRLADIKHGLEVIFHLAQTTHPGHLSSNWEYVATFRSFQLLKHITISSTSGPGFLLCFWIALLMAWNSKTGVIFIDSDCCKKLCISLYLTVIVLHPKNKCSVCSNWFLHLAQRPS